MSNSAVSFSFAAVLCCSAFFSQLAGAETSAHEHQGGGRADSHAPIGVMGDHVHKSGEFMVSYRRMQMSMSGNQQGRDELSSDSIATSVPNRFAGMPNMPPTLRIVPQDMSVSMDMLGLMYAPSDKVTLMGMLNYVAKDMTLLSYMGMMGTNTLGTFDTSTSGLGDTKLSALVSLLQGNQHSVHLNLGVSIPTGDIKQRGQALTPMNMRMDLRLPYAMQLGSGTYDFEPGITYSGRSQKLSWGGQVKAVIRNGENDEGYALGDQQMLTAWGQYLFVPAVSASLRAEMRSIDAISGRDLQIMGPVQTAGPDNYGGDYVDLAFGLNYYGQAGFLKKHRLAFEYSRPLMQDVNGVQMTMDSMLTLGYQYAF